MKTTSIVQAARAAEAAGHMGRVVQLCNEALRFQPQCVNALLMLGSLAARQGQTAKAEEFLRRASAADPNSYDAARWLTTLLVGRSGGAEAVEFGRTAVRLRPREAEAQAVLGLAAMGNGDSDLAIASFQAAIQLDPKMSGAYHNLGVACQRAESYEEAIEALRKAISLAPHIIESYVHLGRCFLGQENGDAALDCGIQALRVNPKSYSVQRLLTDATMVAILGPNGLAHIKRAIDLHPESSFPHALMGSRLQEFGDFAGAEKNILHSIELQPVQGFVYYLLAHNRKFREADRPLVARVEEIAEQNELAQIDRQHIHFGLGKMHDDLGEYEAAMRHFHDANRQPDTVDEEAAVRDMRVQRERILRCVNIFNEEVFAAFKGIGMGSDAPIFVFGMPRSGTTLIEQILSRHTRVGAGGEQFFWRDNSRRIVSIPAKGFNVKGLQAAGQKYLEELRLLAPGKAHVTDKFPSNYIYLGLLHLIYPRATFIHARRHPIDTCLSIYMRPFKTVHDHGQTPRRLVHNYRVYQESMSHWQRVLPPGRILEVEYEQLVRNQEEVTRKLIDYCRLPWEDACLRPQEGDRRVNTFSMWQVRQPVYTTSVERWRNYEPWLGDLRELLDTAPGNQGSTPSC